MPRAQGSNSSSAEVVLVIVAHSDDETIGAGGTIARHAAMGDKVFAISMTDGVGARGEAGANDADRRKSAALKAAKILGFQWSHTASFPDNAMDEVRLLDVVKLVEDAKRRIDPTIIYTHSTADLNVDHRVVAEATLTAFRPQPKERWTEIRAFEIASATDFGHPDVTGTFKPNLAISIEKTWNKKLSALRAYDSEMREPPHARSYDGIENLAKYRGNQAGLKMAEAFQLLRRIER